MTRMTDLYHNSKTVTALKAQSADAEGELEGEIIDTQGFYALLFQLSIGGAVGVTVNSIQESDNADMADAVDVPNTAIIGDLTTKVDTENAVKKINVVPNKRYVKFKVTTEGAVALGAVATLFGADIDGEINAQ